MRKKRLNIYTQHSDGIAEGTGFNQRFQKILQKITGKNRSLQSSIDEALRKLQADVYHPSLRTHRLGGKLAAYLACSCGYDCRIVFSIEKYHDQTEYLLLIDIGTHDDVY